MRLPAKASVVACAVAGRVTPASCNTVIPISKTVRASRLIIVSPLKCEPAARPSSCDDIGFAQRFPTPLTLFPVMYLTKEGIFLMSERQADVQAEISPAMIDAGREAYFQA